jgi:hypothetical protein
MMPHSPNAECEGPTDASHVHPGRAEAWGLITSGNRNRMRIPGRVRRLRPPEMEARPHASAERVTIPAQANLCTNPPNKVNQS